MIYLPKLVNEFENACEKGNIIKVRDIFENPLHEIPGLNCGAFNNIVEMLIYAKFYVACGYGHIEIVKLFIEKAEAMKAYVDCDSGLGNAYRNGHMDIVEFMLNCGAIFSYGKMPKYKDYKRMQVLKYTKMHESLIGMILTKVELYSVYIDHEY